MTYVLLVIGLIYIVGMIVFVVGIRNAVEIDNNEPFLHDDYDPSKDKALKLKVNPEEIICTDRSEKQIEVTISDD